MAKHGHGQTVVDTYIKIDQRSAVCGSCGSRYQGPKAEVKCRGCGVLLHTVEVKCKKMVPTGVFFVANQKTEAPNGK